MRIPYILLTAALLVLATGSATAQRIETLPGYVDISRMERLVDRQATLEVNVKGALLRMAAEAARVEDETLADMLLKLVAIQVRGYSLDRSSTRSIMDPVDDIARELSAKGWDRILRVREDDHLVEMMVRDPSGERIEGMMVFVIDAGENETIFVNIVGQIDPEDIGRIGRRFRIRALQDL